MRKIILMLFVSMVVSIMMLSPVHASEEIQLAAVMNETDSSNLTVNKKLYATGDGRSGGAFYAVSDTDFDYAVIGGVVVILLAVVVEGGSDSTSNH